jgi:hypothetical protein
MGGLGILLFLAAYGLVALETSQKGKQAPQRRTTYSAAAGGYKALYLWLQSLDLPVGRWENTFEALPRDGSVLVLVEPELGPGTGEMDALKEWVSDGRTLVLIASQPNPFLKNMGFALVPVFGMHQWEDKNEALLFQPGSYTQGIHTLESNGHADLTSQHPETVVLIRSKWGGLLAVRAEGSGRVICLSDPNLLSNQALRDGDHARLALNLLLAHRGDGGLLIDEYHHGYGRVTSVLEHLVNSRALVPALQGILLLFVLWAARGRRFGLPRPLIEEKRRSSLEYVKAMAQLFQRGRARVLAFEALVRWTEKEAKNILVHRDHTLQNKLLAARHNPEKQVVSERDLLTSVRGLYSALDEARRKAARGA